MEKLKLYTINIWALVEQKERLSLLLPPARRTGLKRLHSSEDYFHCLAAGLLLRYVLNVYSDSDIIYNEYGKPRLHHDGPCFNLSHGGDYAILATFSDEVGVDIEPITHVKPSIARKIFRDDELLWLNRDSTAERFTTLWTRLEAALKADGCGFSMENREFSIIESSRFRYIQTTYFNDHIISCAAKKPFKVQLKQLNLEQLFGNPNTTDKATV